MDTVELKGFKGLALSLDDEAYSSEQIMQVTTDQIVRSSLQPRKVFAQNEIENLAKSIGERGVLQPLIVRKLGDKFELVAGERRWRASKLAQLETVPVIVKALSDKDVRFIALIENIQRENLNPIEEAEAYRDLIEAYNLTHEKVAEMVGKARVTVSNMVRLLSLSPEIRELVNTKQLEMGHARALLSLDPEKQLEVAELVVLKSLSVRQTEALIKKIILETNPEKQKQALYSDELLESYSQKISNKFNTEVGLSVNKKGGVKVTLSFSSLSELDDLI